MERRRGRLWALAACWMCAVMMLTGCGEDSTLSAEEPLDTASADTEGDTGAPTTDTGETASNPDAEDLADAPDAAVDLNSPTLGQTCTDSAKDCGVGQVCAGADPQRNIPGYCTVLDCQTSADCAFSASADTFCCSTYGEYRACWREDAGTTCGDEGGVQNEACNDGGQSDCDGEAGYYCAAIYSRFDARCMMTCDPSVLLSGCPPDSGCTPVGGGQGLCVSTGDRGALEPCMDDAFSCEFGATCVGAFNRRDPYDYCAVGCGVDADCRDPSLWCMFTPGQGGVCLRKGELPEGTSCTEDRFGCEQGTYCLNAHTRQAVCVRPCTGDSGCEAPSFCNIYDAQTQAGICTTRGALATGESCTYDVRSCARDSTCIGGFEPQPSPDAYCSATCTVSPDSCPSGFYCAFLGADQYYCQPDGAVGVGEVCERPTDCARDTFCVPSAAGERRCAPVCFGDSDCGADTFCLIGDNDQGVCIPHGDQQAGEACADDAFSCAAGLTCAGPDPICLPSCTANPNGCPASMYCLPSRDRGGPRYCYPRGPIPAGQPCDDPYACEAGALCTGDAASPGRCAIFGCRSDGECLQGEWCFQRGATSLCMPTGAATTGQGCADATCASGHLCVHEGTPGAYCARDCTGFADRCADDEVCRFVGDSLNLCMRPGQAAAGDSCAQDPQACDASSLCVGVGTPQATCAQVCTFNPTSCGDGTECFFTERGLGVCVPPGIRPEDPATTAAPPL
jgi:hypothetical protein